LALALPGSHVPTNAAAASVNGPMVNVQSIKMLADTCGR
jgi:hypothetical protein